MSELEEKQKEYTACLDHYTRSAAADMQAMSHMVKDIKGNMSLEAFGKYCGLDKSSLSRLLSGKTQKYIQNHILASLAAAAYCNSNCNVTFDDLAKANGMTFSSSTIKRKNLSRPNESYSGTIISSLLNKGFNVRKHSHQLSDIESALVGFDLTLETDAVNGIWAFDTFFINPRSRKKNINKYVLEHLQSFFSKVELSKAHYDQYTKFSLVLNDRLIKSFIDTDLVYFDLEPNVSIIVMNQQCSEIIQEDFRTCKKVTLQVF